MQVIRSSPQWNCDRKGNDDTVVAKDRDAFENHGRRRDRYDCVFVWGGTRLPAQGDAAEVILAPGWRDAPDAARIEAFILDRKLSPAYEEIINGKA